MTLGSLGRCWGAAAIVMGRTEDDKQSPLPSPLTARKSQGPPPPAPGMYAIEGESTRMAVPSPGLVARVGFVRRDDFGGRMVNWFSRCPQSLSLRHTHDS